MRFQLLVATPSNYRRSWYIAELPRHGFDVEAVESGLECIDRLRAIRPDVLLLETGLRWGGADGVLAAKSEDLQLRNIPVVLVAVGGISTDVYGLARYSPQDFFDGVPRVPDLATRLHQLIRDAAVSAATSEKRLRGHISDTAVCSALQSDNTR